MKKPVDFDEIDFEEIEYRNQYRWTTRLSSILFTLVFPFLLLNNALSLVSGRAWIVVAGMFALGYGAALASLYIRLKSRVLITGAGVTLTRPLLKDVEIPYSEIDSIKFNGRLPDLVDDRAPDLVSLNRSDTKSKSNKANLVIVKSADGKKKISIEQTLDNFEQFCRDLTTRKQLAEERYQGYALGTKAKQPERVKELRAADHRNDSGVALEKGDSNKAQGAARPQAEQNPGDRRYQIPSP